MLMQVQDSIYQSVNVNLVSIGPFEEVEQFFVVVLRYTTYIPIAKGQIISGVPFGARSRSLT